MLTLLACGGLLHAAEYWVAPTAQGGKDC